MRYRIYTALLMLTGVRSVQAQEPAEAAIEESMQLTDILQTGGWLMYVLAVMSIIVIALVFYFFIILQRKQIIPAEEQKQLKEALQADSLQSAENICNTSRTPLCAITGAAIGYLKQTEKPSEAMLKDVVESEGSRQAVLIQNQTQYLLDIATIAPMIGLLGTVMGMLKAFNTVALDIAKAKPMLLAAGVSQALITTAAGLIVGIPAMMFYAYFRGRTSRLLAELEGASAGIVSQLIHRKDS